MSKCQNILSSTGVLKEVVNLSEHESNQQEIIVSKFTKPCTYEREVMTYLFGNFWNDLCLIYAYQFDERLELLIELIKLNY